MNESDPLIAFGKRLEETRRDAAILQEELAERSGISVPTISRLENGKGGKPRITTVRALARVLEVEPAWLISGKTRTTD